VDVTINCFSTETDLDGIEIQKEWGRPLMTSQNFDPLPNIVTSFLDDP
jgi:hypothetical protein